MRLNNTVNHTAEETLSEKERELLDIFKSLDNLGKISVIHTLYSVAFGELLAQMEADCTNNT